ncbi:hypothetical protein T459_30698 [Capsicum annuum]|uniref:Uncharacterized protein n=1 Tax=Capsicum annuum TaxID=4072 RepID=A0A2G2Y943_CAPAN|nr:hypothetical protein T459_30698 [Capsicum annuum]
MTSESLKYYFEFVCMIALSVGIDQNIIYEDYDEHVQVLFEHTVHQVYESSWGITGSEVYLREITDTLKLVKQVIDSGKTILVLDHDFIELMVIYTYSDELSILHTNKTGAPHGEILGLMNPLSKRFFNCSFSSLSSAGAILYGGIEIGRVFERRSIPKSISLSREIPRRSSGKTSEYSFITGTDSRLGASRLESLT